MDILAWEATIIQTGSTLIRNNLLHKVQGRPLYEGARCTRKMTGCTSCCVPVKRLKIHVAIISIKNTKNIQDQCSAINKGDKNLSERDLKITCIIMEYQICIGSNCFLDFLQNLASNGSEYMMMKSALQYDKIQTLSI